MNGLASLLRYQMGGPVGYVDGGQIDSIYQSLFDRDADAEGKAYYEELLKNASVADAIAIIGGGARGEDVQEVTPQEIANKAITAAYENALGRPGADIDEAGMQFYQDQVLNQGLDATLIDNILSASPEAQQRFGEGVTQRQEEAGAFQNLPSVVTDNTGAGAVETIDLPTRPPNVDTTNLFTSTGDTRAVTGPPAPNYDYINDLYKTYLGRDASAEELASYAGIFGPTIEPNELRDFILGGVTSKEISQERADALLGTLPAPTPGPNQILGIPAFARQTPTDLKFAPLRRGIAQLRPAMSMPGLTSGQANFGGPALTPERPSGNLVNPPPTTPFALPEDFALQTGAYGVPTPTFLNRNSTAAGNVAAGPAGVDQPTYAQLLDNVQRLSAQVQPLLPANQTFYDSGGDGGFGDSSPSRGKCNEREWYPQVL
jgi:hypothetical protein